MYPLNPKIIPVNVLAPLEKKIFADSWMILSDLWSKKNQIRSLQLLINFLFIQKIKVKFWEFHSVKDDKSDIIINATESTIRRKIMFVALISTEILLEV